MAFVVIIQNLFFFCGEIWTFYPIWDFLCSWDGEVGRKQETTMQSKCVWITAVLLLFCRWRSLVTWFWRLQSLRWCCSTCTMTGLRPSLPTRSVATLFLLFVLCSLHLQLPSCHCHWFSWHDVNIVMFTMCYLTTFGGGGGGGRRTCELSQQVIIIHR